MPLQDGPAAADLVRPLPAAAAKCATLRHMRGADDGGATRLSSGLRGNRGTGLLRHFASVWACERPAAENTWAVRHGGRGGIISRVRDNCLRDTAFQRALSAAWSILVLTRTPRGLN